MDILVVVGLGEGPYSVNHIYLQETFNKMTLGTYLSSVSSSVDFPTTQRMWSQFFCLMGRGPGVWLPWIFLNSLPNTSLWFPRWQWEIGCACLRVVRLSFGFYFTFLCVFCLWLWTSDFSWPLELSWLFLLSLVQFLEWILCPFIDFDTYYCSILHYWCVCVYVCLFSPSIEF